MADQLSFSPQRAVNANGVPLAGAKAYFYKSGTNIALTVYQDDDATTPHSSPVVADSAGVFPQVFVTESAKVNVTTSSGAAVDGFPIDPAMMIPVSSSAASSVSFTPTSDIPVTNVQGAIEAVQANIVAPLADFGLGVTGNATSLTNIDATNTGSGFYRFTTGASGTFPSGVSASDGGVVAIWRETASAAHMVLIKNNGNTIYHRKMASSAWGSWATTPNLTDNDDLTVSPGDAPTRGNVSAAISSASSASLTSSGYQYMPSGLLMQWGAQSVGSDAVASITFPVAFTNACLTGQASLGYAFNTQSDAGASIYNLSKTGATVRNGSFGTGQINWLVIGH